jgi:putative PIN family toxin of toxin-antitoxin system
MIVVMDTNVLLSGIFYGGVSGQIIDMWGERAFHVYASPSILSEYQRVILDLGVRRNKELADRWHRALPKVCHIIPDREFPTPITRDPDDDKFIICAIAAGADYLVSGDKDIQSLTADFGFVIVSPR